jgi:hypothetical protein
MNGSNPDCLAFEKALRTEEAKPDEIKGSFTLILYGGSYLDDLETIAILDSEGDQYVLEPFVPDFDLQIKKRVPANEAFREAEKFVNFHPAFWRSQLSRIVDNEGKVIGYEVRPLYRPIAFGVSDVLDVNYWPKEKGRVKVTIRLIPSIEKTSCPEVMLVPQAVINSLQEKVINSGLLSREEALSIAEMPGSQIFSLIASANKIREHFRGKTVGLCSIVSAKSGACSEDCTFCSSHRKAERQ